jgi:RNAse (barnase) inhibitor barstar
MLITIDSSAITDWESFHEVFAATFGFSTVMVKTWTPGLTAWGSWMCQMA